MAKLVIGNDKTKAVPAVVALPPYTIELEVVEDGGEKYLVNKKAEKMIDFTGIDGISASALNSAYYGNENITGHVNMSSIKYVGGAPYALYRMFSNTGITSIDLSNLEEVYGESMARNLCYSCMDLKSINLSKLATVSGNDAFHDVASDCPSLESVDLSSLTNVDGESAFNSAFSSDSELHTVKIGPVATCDKRSFYMMCYGCTKLKNVIIDKNNSIFYNYTTSTQIADQQYACRGMFRASGLEEVDMKFNLNGDYVCAEMFQDCTSLKTAYMSVGCPLATNTTYQFRRMFYGCTSLDTYIDTGNAAGCVLYGQNAMAEYFAGCTNLTEVRLPSFGSGSFGSRTNQFKNMCQGIPNITLHFLKDAQAKIESLSGYSTTAPFGADSGTVLFDMYYSCDAQDVNDSSVSVIIYRDSAYNDNGTPKTKWSVYTSDETTKLGEYSTAYNVEPQIGDQVTASNGVTYQITQLY